MGVPVWPATLCDNQSFLCHAAEQVHMQRLDDLWDTDTGHICMAKIDVEGNELRVLRGAATMLRNHKLPIIHIEWWPPHLSAMGEEPAAVPWLLHALGYEIYAPSAWFHGSDLKDRRWVRVVPEQFPFLGSHWGDIIATPAREA